MTDILMSVSVFKVHNKFVFVFYDIFMSVLGIQILDSALVIFRIQLFILMSKNDLSVELKAERFV